MKNLLTTTILLMGLFLTASAQETTIFYQSNAVVATSKDNAKFYVVYQPYVKGLIAYQKFSIDNILIEKGSVLSLSSLSKEGKVLTFYPNGNLKDDVYYESGLPTGEKMHYFENGQVNYKIQQTAAGFGKNSAKKSSTKYNYCVNPKGDILLQNGNGQYEEYGINQELTQKGAVKNYLPDGIWQGYNNGKLSFVEEYKNGILVKGQSFGLNGNSRIYTNKNSRPEPKGGINNFYNYIATAMQDMVIDNDKDLKGEIMLKFIVESSGALKDIKVVKGTQNAQINSMALEVLKKSPKWKPAMQYGEAVETAFFMPLSMR